MNMPFIKANKNRYTWSWISSYIGKFPYSLLRSTPSFYAGVRLSCWSAYSLADYTLISFWWSQVCHHQSADMPHAQAMCWSVVCMSNGGRGKLQTVLISYASHVASSTNRRYLIEILITVGTHSHTHIHTHVLYLYIHCGIAWPELSSLLQDVLCVGTMPFVFGCLLSVITLTS